MTTWVWVSKRVGREALQTSLEHVKHVVKTVTGLKNMVKLVLNGKKDEALKVYDIVYREEEVADDKKREIIKMLSEGVLHPMDRDDILRLVLTSDDVAAFAKATARRIKIVLDTSLKIPKEVLMIVDEMIEKSVNAAELLEKAIGSLVTNPRKALEYADKVEELEEQVDELKMRAYEEAIEYGKNSWDISCIVVKEIIDNVEMISDKCEDAADVIRAIALSRI